MKARFFALAALVLGLASCQKDFDSASTLVGGEVDFQLSVGTEEMTRANDGDDQYGYDSAFGAIDYLCDEADAHRTDWTQVDLRYTLEVYDAEGLNAVPVKDRQVIIVDKYEPVAFDLRLVPNRTYQFVVFADFVPQGATVEDENKEKTMLEHQSDLGLHHFIGNDLRDIKIKSDAINDETTDAYFVSEPRTITNSAAQSIVLTRPYGKVRVIATDLAELNLNVEPKSVEVEYEAAHPAAFNAVTGAIDATYETKKYTSVYNEGVSKSSLANHFYTEGYDAKKSTNLNGDERHTHMTLFTDYILAKDEQESIHFTMTVKDAIKDIKTTNFYTEIPVQRNHLTTIVGNVLTTATEINITIDDNFASETVKDFVLVNTAKELKEAINTYENGKIILFDADIKANETIKIKQTEGVNVIIDGNGYKFDGAIEVNGDARAAGKETLTFQNINFETKDSNFTFISAPSKVDSKYNYSHNVTVKNCTFKANHTVGCVSLTGSYNIVMENCEADNVHSIAQFQSIDNTVRVEGIKVTNSKSGIAFGNTAYPTLKDATIDADFYGVRADANASRGNLVLENVAIDAKFPVLVRKTTTEGYSVEFKGNNTLEAPGYHIVFTKGEDDAEVFEAPEVEFNVVNGDEYYVFPGDKRFAYNQASLQSFLDNTAEGENKIELAANIEGNAIVYQKEGQNVVINGRDYKYDGTISIYGAARHEGAETVVIENINFVADASKTIDFIEQNSTDSALRYAHNVTIQNCTFNGGENAVAMRFRQCFNIVVKDCQVKAGHSLAQLNGCNGVTIENTDVTAGRGVSFGTTNNCVVKGVNFDVESYGLRADGSVSTTLDIENSTIEAYLPVVVRKTTADYKVNFAGVNELTTTGYQVVFTSEADDAAFVAPTSAFEVNGAENFVVFPRDAQTSGIVYNAEELKTALNNAAVTTITLQAGEFGTIVAKSNKTIIGTPNAKVDAVNLNGADNLTLKNINFDAANAVMGYDGKGNKRFYANIISGGANKNNKGTWGLVVDGCTFKGNYENGGMAISFNDQGRGTGQSKNITIQNCTFETTGAYVDIYTYYAGGEKMNIVNNTFKSTLVDYPIYLGRYQSSTPVVVTGNTFEKCANIGEAAYIQAHSSAYTVSFDASNNTFAN